MIHSILFAVTMALAPAAAGPRGAAPQPTPTAQPSQMDTKRYCIIDRTMTGTRISKPVCHSRTEWLQKGYDPLTDQ